MSHISIQHLDIAFGALKVIENLCLDITEGEFVVLLGPSGCGKSTLLNAIGGLLETTSGRIFFGDRDVTHLDPKDRDIGMVFQSYALYPSMTVRRNMSFGLEVAKTPKQEIAAKIDWVADLLQLTPYLSRKPAHLSGGQRQRVAIGRALVRKAGVYLFDEPLSNLDAKLRAELRLEIKKIHQKLAATMVYVTHDQIEALTLADRIAVMKQGQLQQFAPPQDVYNFPANRFVASFVGTPEMNFIEGHFCAQSHNFIAGDFQLDLSAYAFTHPPQDKQKISLGIRPEHFRLSAPSQKTEQPVYQGSVSLIEPMGSSSVIWGKVAGHDISVLTESELTENINDHFSVALQSQKISLFCATDGHRL